MAITLTAERYAQGRTVQGASTTLSPTGTIPPGSFAVMIVTTNVNGKVVSSITDNAGGNTWNVDLAYNATAANENINIISCNVATAISATNTIAIAYAVSTNNQVHIWLEQFAGVATSAALDKTGTGSSVGATITTNVTAPGTLSQADELYVAALCGTPPAGTDLTGWTKATGYSAFATSGISASPASVTEYQVVSSTTGLSAVGTVSAASAAWTTGLVTYKAAATSVSGSVTAVAATAAAAAVVPGISEAVLGVLSTATAAAQVPVAELRIVAPLATATAAAPVPAPSTQIAAPVATATASAVGSATDAYTVLLLHADGADGSTSFTDSSASAHSMTAHADAQVDTAEFKFGQSMLLDGTGDYVSTPDHADFEFGSGDFTIDFWVKPGRVDIAASVISKRSPVGADGFVIYQYSTYLQLYATSNGGSFDVSYGQNFTTGLTTAWHHVALTRSGNDFYGFYDGTQAFTFSTSAALWDNDKPFGIGADSGSEPFNGWLDEIRVSKGIARWTADFTPPVAPYSETSSSTPLIIETVVSPLVTATAQAIVPTLVAPVADVTVVAPVASASATAGDQYTVLLLHADGADTSTLFPDSSAAIHSVTAVGNAQVDTAQSEFGGGSALVAGGGDRLAVADHADFKFGTGDFTIDLWVNLGTTDGGSICAKRASTLYGPFTIFQSYGTSNVVLFMSSTGAGWDIVSGTSIASGVTLGTWHHVALTRTGTTIRAFWDGVQSLSASTAASLFDNSTDLTFGAAADGGESFNGQLDEIRVTKGASRWEANFTPPTAPFTSFNYPVVREAVLSVATAASAAASAPVIAETVLSTLATATAAAVVPTLVTPSPDVTVVVPSPAHAFASGYLLDDFDREDGPVGAQWVDLGGAAVVSNALEFSGASSFIVYNEQFPADCETSWKLVQRVDGSEVWFWLRTDALLGNAVIARIVFGPTGVADDTVQILDLTTATLYGEVTNASLANGDILLFRAEGTTASFYQNGSLVVSATDAGMWTAAGQAAILASAPLARFDDFSGNALAPTIDLGSTTIVVAPAATATGAAVAPIVAEAIVSPVGETTCTAIAPVPLIVPVPPTITVSVPAAIAYAQAGEGYGIGPYGLDAYGGSTPVIIETVVTPLATATAEAIVPTVTTPVTTTVVAPAALATAAAQAPVVAETIVSPLATATAEAPVPTVAAGAAVSIVAPAAAASAAAPTPAVAETVLGVKAAATAGAVIPVIAETVVTPAAAASAAAAIPTLIYGGTLFAPAATATAQAFPPGIVTLLLTAVVCDTLTLTATTCGTLTLTSANDGALTLTTASDTTPALSAAGDATLTLTESVPVT